MMNISDYINIVLCILSFLLAAISVITVVITLRQNNRMIENSTRPYITIYSRVTNFSSPSYYIVLKNSGQSGATIESLITDIDLIYYSFSDEHRPFDNIKDTFVAPGQTIVCNLDPIKMSKEKVDKINFKIEYSTNIKKYDETYTINFLGDTNNIQTRSATRDKELRTISYTLQDLVEKLL